MALYGEHIILVKKNKIWESIHETNITYTKEIYREKGIARYNFTNIDNIEIGIENEPIIKIILFSEDFSKHMIPGGTDGISNNNINIGINNIIYDDFNIMIGYEHEVRLPVYEEWYKIDNLKKCDKYKKKYELDEVKGRIIFGNNINGAIPPKGKFNILISELATTKGEEGNIKEGNINAIKGYSELIVENKKPGKNGKNKETIKEGQIKVYNKINETKVAVIDTDIENVVKNTPGLILKDVKVLPLYNKDKNGFGENVITLVIDLFRNMKSDEIPSQIRKNILLNLDQYRLITTEVLITTPNYVPIEINGEIVIKDNYMDADRIIQNRLNTIINDKYGKYLGCVIRFGDIYSELDMLECVSYVKSLSINAKSSKSFKHANGDLVINPTGRIYLSECNINIAR